MKYIYIRVTNNRLLISDSVCGNKYKLNKSLKSTAKVYMDGNASKPRISKMFGKHKKNFSKQTGV